MNLVPNIVIRGQEFEYKRNSKQRSGRQPLFCIQEETDTYWQLSCAEISKGERGISDFRLERFDNQKSRI
jgi:hypothetical protein